MGKKVKRKVDAFYKRAKIAGYRARSAYKLLQIENKFQVLQGSRVCIDLCAAPGSWMQVAKQTMPLSSIIIGVDLYPIKNIHGTISITGDITTEKVRQELKGKLNTWKADVVLHDGAPNVGQNWLHDAYQQNLLVLSAFKLACEFLRKGGSFVTKVFRSKDYFKLEYVFKKLFKSVNATKPLSSRYESAEIFVVCQHFLDPSKIDQEFFNPKNVFEEIDMEPVNKLNLWKPAKTKPKAEGYPEGATTLYNKVPVSEFIHATNYVEVLQTASELHFEEDESLKNHKLTTQNIIENCKDIKVLGRKELRQLLTWRKELKADLDSIMKEKEKLKKEDDKATACTLDKAEENPEKELDEELMAIEKELDAIKFEQARSQRQKEKKSAKLKKKLIEKMQLKSLVPGDEGPTDTSRELFSLERLSKMQDVDDVLDKEAAEVLSSSEDEEEEKRNEYIVYSKDNQRLDRTGRFWMNPGDNEIDEREEKDEDEEITKESLSFKEDDLKDVDIDDAPGSDKEDVDETVHPLLTDLVGDTRDARRARKANSWFNQDIFQELEDEDGEDFELDNTIKNFEKQGGVVPKKGTKGKEVKTGDEGYTSDNSETEVARDAPEGYSESDSEDDSDSDSEGESEGKEKSKVVIGASGGGLTNATSKKRKMEEGLTPVGLALATQMIHSKKAKRDITDAAWNRYMYGDGDDLPHWFLEDERHHNRLRIEVEPSDIRMYRDRGKDANVKTIKKVVEAKARKQRRIKSRMDKAKKKAENVTNNEELSQKEKALEVNKLYKKAMAPLKKKEAQYVVMKRRNKGLKPKKIKGPYKMVDKRLKKDKRAVKAAEAKKGKPSKTKARPQKKWKKNA